MRIKSLRIRNFRSIDDLKLELDTLTAISGPNSCGKSNVFKAIKFAFQENIVRQDVYDNLIASKRDTLGAPTLSIYIDIELMDCPPVLLTR